MSESALIPLSHSHHLRTLYVREWPAAAGAPVALLIHGMGGDSTGWEQAGEYLQANGYRVLAPDLAGHGDSPRRNHYSPASWAEDILYTLSEEPAPALLIGHSLGGLVTAAVALRLPTRPQVILIDPLIIVPSGILLYTIKRSLRHMKTYTASYLHRTRPTWSGHQINTELSALRRWDPQAVNGLRPAQAARIVKRFQALELPTTILRPRLSFLVPGPWVPGLQRHGAEVISVPKVTHNLHRDDAPGFLSQLERILDQEASP